MWVSIVILKGSPDLLVMIDQHAAHERVRLEALLSGIILPVSVFFILTDGMFILYIRLVCDTTKYVNTDWYCISTSNKVFQCHPTSGY